jgi:tetratricopeptide (TPR) repeat protein
MLAPTVELGAIAFLKGHPIRALNLVARAYLAAELNGDVAAQIRHRTALGEGLAEFGRNDDALQFFQRALDLADSTPGAYFPFTAFVGKARILATTGRSGHAMKMLREGLWESRARGFAIREARLLTTMSDLAEKRGDKDEALRWLKQAAALAERAGLRRIESAAATRLSRLHREIGDQAGAAKFARQSVNAARFSGDAYHLPQLLAELAESEAAIGNVREADATFEHASGLVESLLSDLGQAADRNTLTATMGRVFEGHLR